LQKVCYTQSCRRAKKNAKSQLVKLNSDLSV
jgi:hypothetical protein